MAQDFTKRRNHTDFFWKEPHITCFALYFFSKLETIWREVKRWNLFSSPNSKTFYLGQTLICAPWLRSRAAKFTLSRGEVTLQAGRLQRTTSGSIIKILLKVTMATACWGFTAAPSPNQLPCEMQIQTVWKLVKKNSGWGMQVCEIFMRLVEKRRQHEWHNKGRTLTFSRSFCIIVHTVLYFRPGVLKLVLWNAIFICYTQNSN